MKTGDLVVATRKFPEIEWDLPGCHQDRYIGIYIKEEYGDKFVHCLGPSKRWGRFSPEFWDVEIINENW